MNFASDNTAGIAPAILDAIARANDGFAPGYGDDATTKDVERRLSELFEREVAAFVVPTGTAANALAIAQVTMSTVRASATRWRGTPAEATCGRVRQ